MTRRSGRAPLRFEPASVQRAPIRSDGASHSSGMSSDQLSMCLLEVDFTRTIIRVWPGALTTTIGDDPSIRVHV